MLFTTGTVWKDSCCSLWGRGFRWHTSWATADLPRQRCRHIHQYVHVTWHHGIWWQPSTGEFQPFIHAWTLHCV